MLLVGFLRVVFFMIIILFNHDIDKDKKLYHNWTDLILCFIVCTAKQCVIFLSCIRTVTNTQNILSSYARGEKVFCNFLCFYITQHQRLCFGKVQKACYSASSYLFNDLGRQGNTKQCNIATIRNQPRKWSTAVTKAHVRLLLKLTSIATHTHTDSQTPEIKHTEQQRLGQHGRPSYRAFSRRPKRNEAMAFPFESVLSLTPP